MWSYYSGRGGSSWVWNGVHARGRSRWKKAEEKIIIKNKYSYLLLNSYLLKYLWNLDL
jgi:hypothetical protein